MVATIKKSSTGFSENVLALKQFMEQQKYKK